MSGHTGGVDPVSATAAVAPGRLVVVDERAASDRAAEVRARADQVLRADGADGAEPDAVLAAVRAGATVALVTPGPVTSAAVVGAVVDAGLLVEVVPGADPGIAALVASGLPTDRFVVDPSPPDPAERRTTVVPGETGVVVLPGAPEPAPGPASDDDVRAALRAARDRGLSPGRAAAEVAAATGRSRRDVYDLGAGGDGT